MEYIKLTNINKSYVSGDNKIEVLKNLNLTVENGEFLVILGESGSGKSTLLHIIGGLDHPDSGEIVINNRKYCSKSDEELSELRRKEIGFVFQKFNLIPVLSVFENIVLPISLDGGKIDDKYISYLLERLGIINKKFELPSKLSGGQQQRVAIARALANRPNLILADEPTGNLDKKSGDEVLKYLLESIRMYGKTLIMITHNQKIAELADRVLLLEDGILLPVNC